MKEGEMKDLKNLFREHKKVLCTLQGLLREERDALLNDSVTDLTAVIEKKVACAEELERLESTRNANYSHVTVSYLEQLKKEKEADSQEIVLIDEVIDIMTELQRISMNLRLEQDSNTLLIQQNMAYSNMMMQTIQDIVKKAGVYGKDGKMDQSPVKAGLDKSV